MNNEISRFYSVSSVFRDDLRLVCIAIKEFTKPKETKCAIYLDLLNCKYKKWIDRIEIAAQLISEDWLNYKEFMFDNGHDTTFTKGDIYMIEMICMEEE